MKKLFINSIFRGFRKKVSFTLINIIGLSIGLASSIIIFLWVTHENSFDTFHKKHDNIYRLMSYGTKYMVEGYYGAPFPLADAMKKELPEIKQSLRFIYPRQLNFKYEDKKFIENKGVIVDSTFFDLFSFELIQGNPKLVLREPYTIVICEDMAKRYFGNENPIGKVLEMGNKAFTVNGLVKNIPKNSSINFEFAIPLIHWEKEKGYPTNLWGMFMAHTFIELPSNVNIREVENRLTEIALNHECPQVKDGGVVFKLQPLSEIHLDAKHTYFLSYMDIGSKKTVIIFTSIALMLLFLATINYINLTTADSDEKSKEIGIKKILGSSRKSLINHIYIEGLIAIFIAFDLALLLIEMILPMFNNLTGRDFVFSDLLKDSFGLFIIGIFITTWLLAGSYPAFYLSSLKTNKIINTGNKSNQSNSIFRKILVVFQFCISIVLIICSLVIYKQMHYIKSKDIGFDIKNIIHVPLKGNFANNFFQIKNRLQDNPSIEMVSAQDYLWAVESNRTTGIHWEGKSEEDRRDMLIPEVDFDYMKLLGMEIIEGRNFNSKYRTDSNNAYILNETALLKTGISEPIGKNFWVVKNSKWVKGEIVGIAKNVHFNSLREEIEPLVMSILTKPENNTTFGIVLIKFKPNQPKQAINAVKSVWEETNPNIPFEYSYLEETYKNLYSDENKASKVILSFSLLAILISCLGLFGLTSFMIDKRTKEIGIRKANGASSSNIVFMFISEFIKLIFIAYIIAVPIAYYFMNNWLERFAFKTKMGVMIYIIAIAIVLLISCLSIIFKAVKSSNQNPSKSLRYE